MQATLSRLFVAKAVGAFLGQLQLSPHRVFAFVVVTHYACLLPLLTRVYCMQAIQSRSTVAKAVGAFMGQLAELPEQQFQHWWASHTVTDSVGLTTPAAAASAANWVEYCCPALVQAGGFKLDSTQGDPLQQLLQWVLQAVQLDPRRRDLQQPSPEQEQQQQGQQQEQHPAEGLRQVLDVVYSALQYRHMVNLHE
jgi:hypothetical protein